MPSTRPARITAGLATAASAGVMVAGGVWAVNRADVGLLLANVGLEEARVAASAALSDVILAAVGQTGLDAWAAGGPMVALSAGAGFIVAAGAVVAGLRVITAARRRQS